MSTRIPSQVSTASNPALTSLLFPATSIVGVLVAYFLVNEQWQIALLLISFLPGVILLQRHPFLAVIAWLSAVPFLLEAGTAAERQLYWMVHRALPPITVGILLATSGSGIDRRSPARLGVPELAMAGYVGLTLLSIYLENLNPLPTTFLFYDRVFVPMCLYLIIRLSPFGEKEMRWLIVAALFISVSQTIVGILSWVAPQVLPPAWLDKAGSRTVGSLVNAAVYTSTLTFSGLLVLHAALNSRSGPLPGVYKLTFVLCAYSIFLSFSRASWLAGILVLLGLLYLYPGFTVRLGLVVGVSVVLLAGGVLASQLDWAKERLYSEEAEMSALSRLPVFYAAYRMFEAKPLFGWGYGNFDLYDRRYYDQVLDLPNDNKDHASHNSYLTMAAEQGIVGLLLYFAPFLTWLVLSWRRLPRMPETGFWSRKLVIILWLVLFSHIIVNSFQNLTVVFGLGMWWITLALIANLVDVYPLPDRVESNGAGSLPRPRV